MPKIYVVLTVKGTVMAPLVYDAGEEPLRSSWGAVCGAKGAFNIPSGIIIKGGWQQWHDSHRQVLEHGILSHYLKPYLWF